MQPPAVPPFDTSRITPLTTLLTMEPPPLIWDVEGLLARNERCVLYGEFGSLKSWLLMSLTLAFATGTPWLGQYTTQPRSVLYLDEENARQTAIRRFQRLYKGLEEPPLLQPVQIASRLGIKAQRGLADRLRATFDALSFTPQVIIIETLRRVLVGAENDQQPISEFWRLVTDVIRDDMTVIVAHHMRKPNVTIPDENSRDRASGNTDILAGADVCYAVERIQAGQVRIVCGKSREVAEPMGFGVELDAPDREGPAKLVPFLPLDHTGEATITKILMAQPDQQCTTHVLEALCREHGLSRATIFRHLKSMEERFIITTPSHGLWKLTPTTLRPTVVSLVSGEGPP